MAAHLAVAEVLTEVLASLNVEAEVVEVEEAEVEVAEVEAEGAEVAAPRNMAYTKCRLGNGSVSVPVLAVLDF